MIEQARRVSLGEQETFAVKGPTPQMLIPLFDLVKGFIGDPMHCLGLGMMRQLAALWFDSKEKRNHHLSPHKHYPNTQVFKSESLSKESEWRAFEGNCSEALLANLFFFLLLQQTSIYSFL